jgi:hypothetical protein
LIKNRFLSEYSKYFGIFMGTQSPKNLFSTKFNKIQKFFKKYNKKFK